MRLAQGLYLRIPSCKPRWPPFLSFPSSGRPSSSSIFCNLSSYQPSGRGGGSGRLEGSFLQGPLLPKQASPQNPTPTLQQKPRSIPDTHPSIPWMQTASIKRTTEDPEAPCHDHWPQAVVNWPQIMKGAQAPWLARPRLSIRFPSNQETCRKAGEVHFTPDGTAKTQGANGVSEGTVGLPALRGKRGTPSLTVAFSCRTSLAKAFTVFSCSCRSGGMVFWTTENGGRRVRRVRFLEDS